MQVRYLSILLVICCLQAAQCSEHPDGISQVSRVQDAAGDYHFSYAVTNNEGEQFRKEGTDSLGRVVGSYGLKHNDGTHRVVDYVADKHGFRAEVRSNEPGVASAESADVSIIRTDQPSPPLSVAATSNDNIREKFGTRLRTDGSRVAYVAAEGTKSRDPLDETVRETRQRNFDDYRPLSPVAYYPTVVRNPVVAPLHPAVQRPVDKPRSPRVLPQTPEADHKPLEVYFPPIDPHTAIRRPAVYVPRGSGSDRDYYSTSTSQRPYIPPYGGFDDDPLPEARYPEVSMTTVHGGLGSRRHLPSPAPTPAYGAGRNPFDDLPNRRDFSLPRFPPLETGFPSVGPRRPGGAPLVPHGPSFPQGLPQTPLFNPPSYEGGIGNSNFVLRAVRIPNGIQAVRVDPSTGRVYERLVYPLYIRHDGHPAYDKNILLHNDDVNDDGTIRHDNSGYFDIPFPSSAAFRGARDKSFDEDEDHPDRPTGRRNGNFTIDESNLSKPTASDLAGIYRQLSMVEGFDVDRFANRLLPNGLSYRDSESPVDDRFTENNSRFGNGSPVSQLRMRYSPGLFEYRNEDGFSRNPRHEDDGLSPEDSRRVSSGETLGESASDLKPVDESVSKIEKEDN